MRFLSVVCSWYWICRGQSNSSDSHARDIWRLAQLTFSLPYSKLPTFINANPGGIHLACHSRTTLGPPQVLCGILSRNQKWLGLKFPGGTQSQSCYIIHLLSSCYGFPLFFFQLEGAYLVEIFCEVEMDAYERAVGESFSNLAFEAVEKIISVSCKWLD